MAATEGRGDEHESLTVVEAGRLGGERVKRRYGSAYDAEHGKKGGRTLRARCGASYSSEIGT